MNAVDPLVGIVIDPLINMVQIKHGHIPSSMFDPSYVKERGELLNGKLREMAFVPKYSIIDGKKAAMSMIEGWWQASAAETSDIAPQYIHILYPLEAEEFSLLLIIDGVHILCHKDVFKWDAFKYARTFFEVKMKRLISRKAKRWTSIIAYA